MQTHSEFITLKEKVLRHVHHPYVPERRDPWRCAQTRENRVETQKLCGSPIQNVKEQILSGHREIRDFLELRADQAARGEKVALSRLSDAGISYEIAS